MLSPSIISFLLYYSFMYGPLSEVTGKKVDWLDVPYWQPTQQWIMFRYQVFMNKHRSVLIIFFFPGKNYIQIYTWNISLGRSEAFPLLLFFWITPEMGCKSGVYYFKPVPSYLCGKDSCKGSHIFLSLVMGNSHEATDVGWKVATMQWQYISQKSEPTTCTFQTCTSHIYHFYFVRLWLHMTNLMD